MKHIPNIVTLCNLLCGCIAISEAMYGHFLSAALFILIAGACDFLDGLLARLMRVQSALGVQLDSLSDLISFGLAPSFFAFFILQSSLSRYSIDINFSYIAFAIVIFSALRLAKFNITPSNHSYFTGLPTPANALLWVAMLLFFSYNDFLPYATFIYTDFIDTTSQNIDKVLEYNCYEQVRNFLCHPITVVALIVYTSFLLISPIKMFSLKMSGLSKNLPIFVFLWILLITFYFFGMLSVIICIAILYPIISNIRQQS